MKRPLIWNDWRATSGLVAWFTALFAALGFVARAIDDVRGLAVFASIFALFLGHIVTSTDTSVATREFYLTRPVSRRRYLRSRLVFSAAILNAFVLGISAMIWLDTPSWFYGHFAESNAAARVIQFDFPAWYPTAILLPNLVLVVVISAQMTTRGKSSGAMYGGLLGIGVPILAVMLVARYPHEYVTLALAFAVAIAAGLVVSLVQMFRRFDAFDVTGGYA